jgi:hypothetical protein
VEKLIDSEVRSIVREDPRRSAFRFFAFCRDVAENEFLPSLSGEGDFLFPLPSDFW